MAAVALAPFIHHDIDGLVEDCSNSSVLAMEPLHFCTNPSIFNLIITLFILPFLNETRYYFLQKELWKNIPKTSNQWRKKKTKKTIISH